MHNYDVTVQGAAGAWSGLTLRYPNRASEVWTPTLSNAGLPTGAFTVPTGAPYIVSGTPSATVGQWTALNVMFHDQSVWTLTPDPNVVNNYLLTQITNLVGHFITLQYDAQDRLVQVTNDAGTVLLSLSYANTGGYLSSLKEYSDPNNPRGISYGFTAQNTYDLLSTVSQIYYTSAPTTNVRWQYSYTTGVGGIPFLNAVSVPNPNINGPAGLISNAITYNTTTGAVSTLQDANSFQRLYTGATTVSVQASGATSPALAWTQHFAAPFLDTGTTDGLGNSDQIIYGDNTNPYAPTQAIDKNGNKVEIAYVAANGNVETFTDSRGTTTTYSYQYLLGGANFSLGWLSQVQTGTKTPTTITYYNGTTQAGGVPQALGLLQTVSTPQPGTVGPGGVVTGPQVTTTYTYTALGNIATITVPGPNTIAGSTVTYTYGYTDNGNAEALNEPTSVKDPLGNVTSYQWNRGNLVSVTDALGNQTQFQYNVADQLVQAIYPITVGPDHAYTLIQYLYPGGPVQYTQLWNEAGTMIREVDRAGGNEDELLKLSNSVPTVKNIYDPLYRGSQLTDGNGNTSTQSYDAASNPNLFTLPDYNLSTYFDTVHTAPTGGFDPDGNPLIVYDGRDKETDLTYNDPESLLTEVSYTNQSQSSLNVSYVYDAYGRVSQRTDGSSQETYTYDDRDGVTSVNTVYLSGGNALFTTDVSYNYNNDGTRSSMNASSINAAGMNMPIGSFQYKYDNADRLTTLTFPWNGVVTYGYENNNWLASQSSFYNTIALPITTQYSYNARGQLTTLTNTIPFQKPLTPLTLSNFSNMTYDGVGNRLSMTVSIPLVQQTPGNPTSLYAAGLSGSVSWQYDNQNHLIEETNSLTSVGGGGTDQYAVPYTYYHNVDADENLLSLRSLMVNTPNLGYNADDQLTQVTLGNANYASEWAAVTYDGDGNPLTYPLLNSGARATTFDPEDRLTFLQGFLKPSYFADGRRASNYATTNNATYYLYDGNTLLCELNASGVVQTTYGFGAAGLVQRFVPASGVTYGYTFDPSGNVVQRHSNIHLAESIYADFTTFYDAFGGQLHQIDVTTGSSFQAPDAVGFGGQWGYYTENVTFPAASPGSMPVVRYPLCLLGARFYDPLVGRFLNRDPVGYDGGINLYAFCGNNPVMGADPSGLRPLTPQDIGALTMLYKWADPLITAHDKNAAISAIKAAIAAVPNGSADPVSLKAVLWGLGRLGDNRYGNIKDYKAGANIPGFGDLPGLRGMTGLDPKTAKCNYFVGYAIGIGGGVGFGGNNGYPIHNGWSKSPIGAGLLYSSSYNNAHLPQVQSAHLGLAPEPAIGDIVSWSVGHTSLYTGGGLFLYAGPEGVKVQTLNYVEAAFNMALHNVRRWQ